jgi:hypothetical protein
MQKIRAWDTLCTAQLVITLHSNRKSACRGTESSWVAECTEQVMQTTYTDASRSALALEGQAGDCNTRM